MAEGFDVTTNDDVSGQFLQNHEQHSLDVLKQSLFGDMEPEGEQATSATDAKKEEDPEDPLGIRIWKTTTSVLGDIGKGMIESPRQIIGGARDAVQETMEAIDSLAQYLNEHVADFSSLETEKFNLPEVDNPESVTGGLVHGVAQFITGFIPAFKAVKAANAGKLAVTALGKFAQVETAAAITAATVIDPHEDRLSNLIQKFPILENPVTEYLAAGPEDTEAEGRFKNAAEGLGLATLGVGLVKAVKAIKLNRIAHGVEPEHPLGAPDEPIVKDIGDPEKPFVTDEAFKAFQEGNKTRQDAFNDLASMQRGEPENAMLAVQFKNGGGVINPVVEHVGDLIHRMSENFEAFKGQRTLVLDKIDKSLSFLKNSFGFKKEFDQNIRNNAQAKGVDEATFRKELSNSLKRYGEAHSKLKVFNRPQELARDAAIAIGNQDWKQAIKHLENLREIVSNKEAYEKAVGEFKPIKSEHGIKDLIFGMNWARFTDSDQMEEGLRGVAQLLERQMDKARRGQLGDAEVRQLADEMGLTPKQLMEMPVGEAANAETIVAAKMLVEASFTKLQEMASIATNSLDEADLFRAMKMFNIHSALQLRFQGFASEAGRALRALQIPTGTKSRQLMELNHMLMQKGGPDQVRQFMHAIEGITDPADMGKVVRGSFGKRFADAAVEAWYFNLLSGPQTHMVNITSTGVNTFWQVPERFLAAQISKFRGDESGIAVGEAKHMLYGMMESIGDAFRMAGRAIKTGEGIDQFGKVEARTQAAISSKNFGFQGEVGSVGNFMNLLLDGLGAVYRAPTRALMAEDTFFKVVAQGMAKKAAAFRIASREGLEGDALAARMQEIIKNPTQGFDDEIVRFANDVTFTAPLGKTGQGFQALLNRHPYTKFVLPFVGTPTNLVKWAGKRTPLGILSKGIRDDIKRGGPEGALALSRMAIGSATTMLFMDMAMKGQITGAGPADPELSRTWRRVHPPFSVHIGDTWYSYNRADPLGLIISVSASLAEMGPYLDTDTFGTLATGIAAAISKSALNKTWLKGPADFTEAVFNPQGKNFERWFNRQVGTLLVPAGAAQVVRTFDPVWREINDAMDGVRARTPGLSKDLPPIRNLWGQKIVLEGSMTERTMNPFYQWKDKARPIDKWLLENRVNAEMPSRVQLGVELTPQEYSHFVELAGNGVKDPATGMGLYDTLNAILDGSHPDSVSWAEETDGEEGGRQLIVRGYIQTFRAMAQEEMLKDPMFNARVDIANKFKEDALTRGPKEAEQRRKEALDQLDLGIGVGDGN